MHRSRTLDLAALSTVPFVMVLGNSMLIPVLPEIKRALNLTPCEVSLVITLFSVSAGLAIPLCGYLSDRLGRKQVMIPALLLYGLGGLVAGVAAALGFREAYLWILGGRVLQGAGAAGTAPIAMALTGDLFQGSARSQALGVIEAANGMGKVVSPIIGAALGLLAWWVPFFAFPALNVISAAAVWRGAAEAKQERTRTGLRSYLRALVGVFEQRTGLLLTSFLAGMLVLLILFGLLFYLSELLEARYHFEGVVKGLILAIPVFFMALTSYITGLVVKKRFTVMKIAVIAGLAVTAAALGVLPFLRNTLPFFVTISLVGVGAGLALPCLNTIITSTTGTEKRGLVTALYGGVRFFGVAAGPPLFSILLAGGRPLIAWTCGGAAVIVAILVIFFCKPADFPPGKGTMHR